MTANSNSILDSVKKALGIDASDPSFDVDVIMHVNSALGILRQIGVGDESGYAIDDNSAVWTDFTDDIVILSPLKSYIVLKVRLWFDPPQNSKTIDSMEKQVVELEARLNMLAEQINPPDTPPKRRQHVGIPDEVIVGYLFGETGL
jgi:hypothetical protein